MQSSYHHTDMNKELFLLKEGMDTEFSNSEESSTSCPELSTICEDASLTTPDSNENEIVSESFGFLAEEKQQSEKDQTMKTKCDLKLLKCENSDKGMRKSPLN